MACTNVLLLPFVVSALLLTCWEWHAGCPIAIFGGPAMRALHNLVQRNQRRFAQPPLGPLGALLSVDDIRWAGAIEAALRKQFLESWIVDNRADHRMLMVCAPFLRL